MSSAYQHRADTRPHDEGENAAMLRSLSDEVLLGPLATRP